MSDATEGAQAAGLPRGARLLVWVPLLLAIPVLLRNAIHILPYMPDDSLIVARYAERLIEGHGLTWTDGERVEGYSNLLWTVSIAGIGALGVDILIAARVLGVICMATVFVALARAHPPRTLAELVPPTIAALLFASAGPIGVWAIGGLEQPMVAALLAWALVAVFPILDREDESRRRALLVGLPLGLLCWTRPDGPLFTAVFAGVTVVVFRLRRTGWILALRMTVLPVLAVALQLGFRLIYYRDWLPNPAYIKARVVDERVTDGFEYILEAREWMVPALILAGLSLVVSVVDKHQRGRALLLSCCFLAWAAYVIMVGGDIFHGRRHWVPLWLLLTFMVAIGLDWVVRRERAWLTIAVALTSIAAVGRLNHLQREDPTIRLAKRQDWQWEGEILARVLGRGFEAERPLIAVTAAGTLPYFSKLPALDMLGLNDRHIARQRPPLDEVGYLAHDHADGEYVLDREPDMIIFNLGGRPEYRTGAQIRRDERFKRDYTPVVFRGYVPHERDGKVFVRVRGRIGVQIEDDLVIVPGYLLGGRDVFAQPGIDGGIETVIPTNARLTSPPIPLEPGTWRVTVDPPNPNVDVGLLVARRAPREVLTVTKDEYVRLRLTAEVGSLLGTIRIERIADGHAASPEPAVAEPPSYTAESLGDFETGLDGWRVDGSAFAKNPATGPSRRQAPITGNVGKFLNSFGLESGDRVQGTLISAPFFVDEGTILSFRIGGGKYWTIGVRLMDGDRTLMAWHGRDKENLEEVRFALTPYAGRILHIEVYDEARHRWGHILADEFLLLHPTATKPQ